ncbi:MAG: hypothetical protein AAB387_10810 [candidate division NC10 bacterium]
MGVEDPGLNQPRRPGTRSNSKAGLGPGAVKFAQCTLMKEPDSVTCTKAQSSE